MIQPDRDTGGETLSLCSIRLNGEVFGIDTLQVHEVLGESKVYAVPLVHDSIGGMMPYRGEVLPVVCARRLLGLPPRDGAANVLILRAPGDQELFGFAVDEVNDVLTVEAASFEPNPCTLDARRKSIFAGAYKAADGLIVVLRPELLRPERLAEMQPQSSTAAIERKHT